MPRPVRGSHGHLVDRRIWRERLWLSKRHRATDWEIVEQADDEEQAESVGQEIGVGYAAKKGPRTEKNPSKGMIRKDSELAEIWKESMITERKGIIEATHTVSEEEAKRVGVTPHVTDRSTGGARLG